MTTVPKGFSRKVHWGPSSNAGGHPMDLHLPSRPPTEPQAAHSQSHNSLPTASGASVRSAIELSPNVRDHLYAIFFDHIQQPFPVVSRKSLHRFPPTPLLEATILGAAACHHKAIASWRDIDHIRGIVSLQLKDAIGFQQVYQPKIQTLQAFLLLSMKVELSTNGHSDAMSVPLRLGMLCQMAADLGIDGQSSTAEGDEELYAVLWKACLFQDAFLSAIFGQPLNIPVSPRVTFESISGATEHSNNAYFDTAVQASHCLRHILRAVYATKTFSEANMIARSREALTQARLYEDQLEVRKEQYTGHEYRALRMFHHNNRLLLVLGLAGFTEGSHQRAGVSELIALEARYIVSEACQTLTWLDVDFVQSTPCQLVHLLYCGSRAAMLAVDVLLEARRTHCMRREDVQNLENAISAARTLKDFLLKDRIWGSHWAQGHTLDAVLARLEDTADCFRPPMPLELKTGVGLQASTAAAADISIPQVTPMPGAYDHSHLIYDEDLLRNVLFNPTDWDAVLTAYGEPSWLTQQLDIYQSTADYYSDPGFAENSTGML